MNENMSKNDMISKTRMNMKYLNENNNESMSDYTLQNKIDQKTLYDFLLRQKEQDKLQQRKIHQSLNYQKKNQNLLLKQQQSLGTIQHPTHFKKSVKILEFFQQQKPVLRGQIDPQLNTFDNSKRFLKEITVTQNLKYKLQQELRQNNFKHYKGSPWSYIHKNPQFFNDFQANLEQEVEIAPVPKEPIFKPVSKASHKELFNLNMIDKFRIILQSNPIHDVVYQMDKKPNQEQKHPQSSKLNQRQYVRPFFTCKSSSEYLQKDFIKETTKPYQSNQNYQNLYQHPEPQYLEN